MINSRTSARQIEARSATAAPSACRIRYSREREALETAGGIAHALPLLGARAVPGGQRRHLLRLRLRRAARASPSDGASRIWCWCPIRRSTRRATSPSPAAASGNARGAALHFHRHRAAVRRALFVASARGRQGAARAAAARRRASAARVSGEHYRGCGTTSAPRERLRRTRRAAARKDEDWSMNANDLTRARSGARGARQRLAQAMPARRRDHAHRAGARAQPRHAVPVPLRQLFLLPDRLPGAGGGAGAGRRRGAAADAVLPREERGARDLGRLSLRAGGARGSASASTRRTRSPSSTRSWPRCSPTSPRSTTPWAPTRTGTRA